MKTHIAGLNGGTSTIIMAGFWKHSDLCKKKELVVVSNDELNAGDEIYLIMGSYFYTTGKMHETFKNIEILEKKETRLNYKYSYRLRYE